MTVLRQVNMKQQFRPSMLYRGCATSCLQNGLTFGILFGAFDYFKRPASQGGCELSLPLAAMAASVPEAAVRGPLEALKNMQQTGTACFSWSRLGKATFAMLCREAPGNVVYLGTYTAAKERLGRSSLEAGGLAGIAYAVCIYPIDSVRTQIATGQTQIRPTYKGVSTFALRIGSYGALMFCLADVLKERSSFNFTSSISDALPPFPLVQGTYAS